MEGNARPVAPARLLALTFLVRERTLHWLHVE